MDKVKQFIEEKEYNIVFKKEVDFKNPEEYLKTVIFLANGKRVGYIIFGVDKTNKIIGIKKVKKSYQEIIRNIKYIKPDINPIIKIAHIEEKNIILVKINPGTNKPYCYIFKT